MTSETTSGQGPKPIKVEKSLTDRTFTGLLWMFSGSATQAVLKLTVLIVLARLLSPAEFGLLGAAIVVVSFGQIVSRLGIGPALVQRSELSEDHLRAGFMLAMTLALVIAFVVCLGADAIAGFFRMEDLAPIVQIMSLIFPIAGFGIVAEARIQREMGFKALAGIEVFSYAIGYGIFGIALAILGFGVWALVVAQLAQAALATICLWLVKPHSISLLFPLRAAGELLNYGAGHSIAKVGNSLAQQADNLVVGRWLGAEALGMYGRAYSVLMMPTNLIGAVLGKVLFPAMASVQEDRPRLSRMYIRAVAAIALLALPASGLLVVVAPELIHILLGDKWGDVALPLQLLAVILVFRVGYKLSDSLARALGAVYRRAWRQWIYAGAVFTGAWVGHHWGLRGVAGGVAAAVLLNYLLMLQLSVNLLGLSWRSIARLHAHYLALALLTTAGAWLAAEIGRGFDLHQLVVLLMAVLSAGCVVFMLHVLSVPWVDDNGKWIIARLKARINL